MDEIFAPKNLSSDVDSAFVRCKKFAIYLSIRQKIYEHDLPSYVLGVYLKRLCFIRHMSDCLYGGD